MKRLAASMFALAIVGAVLIAAPAQAVGETISVTLTTADGSAKLAPQATITLGGVSNGATNVRVNDSRTYQTMVGFGAAFTDSSTLLLNRVNQFNATTYNNLMNDMFNTNTGLGWSFWRVPIGSNDFATTATHWNNAAVQGPAGDPTQNFALTAQDTGHIIPVINDALAVNPGIKTVASAWSPPGWMKSNNSMICNTGGVDSTLLPAHNQSYADYIRKWIQAYQAQGIPIWAVTPINEPLYCPPTYPGMSWTAAGEAAWVHNYLKPTLNGAGLTPKILGFDHNFTQPVFARDLLNSAAGPDLAGMAWHCYDNIADPAWMTQIYHMDPNKEVYETECSSDTQPLDIIRFSTAEMTLLSAQNYAKGVGLWNVALDANHGPHLGGCSTCLPLVQIDTTVDGSGQVTSATVTKTNNYYQFGQISKFVKPGAVRIDSTVNAHGIVTGAFKNPSGQEVLVATNTNASSTTFTVTWNNAGSFSYTLPSRATVTFTGNIPAAPVLSTTPTAGHTYRIISRASGKPMGVTGPSTADGALILQWTDSADPDQRWTLNDAGSGYFNVINVNSAKALDNPGGSTTNGTQMQQWSISGTGNFNQQWQISSAGGGWYTIVNRTSGKALDIRDGAVADGAAAQQWTPGGGNPNQQFKFLPVN